jgi:phosphoenolpyruvate-protein phosphotransferase (PTS system enzyme I)
MTPLPEITLKGTAAAPGISFGPAYLYAKHIPKIEQKVVAPSDTTAEIERLRHAVARAEKELQKILAFAEHKIGADSARIFEAQIMILSDAYLMGAIEQRIKTEGVNAEYVVADEISKYKRLMLAASEEYMHERARDVDDVMHRIIRNINDQKLFSRLEGEWIIVAESLAPADTVIFSRNQILGYATDLGGVSSHAAILSRSLKIPAVVGLRGATKQIGTGDRLAIDGYAGLIIINPTEETEKQLLRKAQRFQEFQDRLVDLVSLDAETIDHRHLELSANLEFAEEIAYAHRQGAAGVGLFRTESQLFANVAYPSEEQQYAAYQTVADAVYPHGVIFRAFDVGGDKLIPDMPPEQNPFLGWRGIRVLLDKEELFLGQLRAMLRASAKKNVRIMFPMVSTVQEVRKAKEFVTRAKEELQQQGIPYDPGIKVGVMIEVPSAALMADQIAAEVDFFSIGTNDLIQYIMAVDRDNNAVAPLYQQFNPAVIRAIKMIVDGGHKKNIWVGMCGEMAGDPLATVLLVGLGLDELSVVPSVLPEIKKIIRSIKYKDAKRVAEAALGMGCADDIREYLSSIIKNKIPEIPLEP